MKPSRVIALVAAQALIACVLVGCGISKKPKNHWFQFWRTKAKKTAARPKAKRRAGARARPKLG